MKRLFCSSGTDVQNVWIITCVLSVQSRTSYTVFKTRSSLCFILYTIFFMRCKNLEIVLYNLRLDANHRNKIKFLSQKKKG